MLPSDLPSYLLANQHKFLNASSNLDFDYTWLTKHLVPHKHKPRMLYCLLTRAVVNNVRADIEKHVNGRRFKTKVYQEWKKKTLKLQKTLKYKEKVEEKIRKKKGLTGK